jgi:hypothetical protein
MCPVVGFAISSVEPSDSWLWETSLCSDAICPDLHSYRRSQANDPLLLRMREVPGSNLSPETGYSYWEFFVVYLSRSSKCRVSTLQWGPLPSKSFIIHHSPITRLFDAI